MDGGYNKKEYIKKRVSKSEVEEKRVRKKI
jgi:hypothetical protein